VFKAQTEKNSSLPISKNPLPNLGNLPPGWESIINKLKMRKFCLTFSTSTYVKAVVHCFDVWQMLSAIKRPKEIENTTWCPQDSK